MFVSILISSKSIGKHFWMRNNTSLIMFGKHIKENPVAIDITQKCVKIWWGGTKLVLTTKAEQRKMREMIQHIDPSITVIDSTVP